MKHKVRIVSALCLALAGLLAGCAARAGAGKESGYQIAESEKLTIYTSHKKEVYEPIVREFEERTGIFVEVRQGGSLELFDQIAKSGAGESCDVIFGGGIENYIAYQDYLEAYRAAGEEMIEERYRCAGHKWTAFSVLPIVLIYNNKLVYPAAAPHSWEELLEEKWKGKVAFADPAASGSSYTALCTMIQALGEGEEQALERFSKVLDGHVSESSGDVLEEVNSGSMLVGVTLEDTARERISQGADLSFLYPEEGTSAVPDAAAIVKGARHRENARKFLDFAVSRDAQRFLSDTLFRQTVRTDIETADRGETGKNDMRVLDYDVVWAVREKNGILEEWARLQKDTER